MNYFSLNFTGFICALVLLGCNEDPVSSISHDLNYKIVVEFEESLAIMNTDGSGLEKVHEPASILYAVSWSPDGLKVAYSAYSLIEYVHSDGSNHFSTGQFGRTLSWIDTETFVYSAGGRIYSMNTVSNSKTSLANGRNPIVSPLGDKIAFRENNGLYVMKGDGSNIQHLADSIGMGSVAWSPDGGRIAFHKNGALMTIYFKGGEIIRLTEENVLSNEGSRFSWSPDGTRLAYMHRLGSTNEYALGVANADGSGSRIIVEEWIGHPMWLPDPKEEMIFYYSYSHRAIMKVKPDGSQATKVFHIHRPSTFDISPVPLP